MSWKAIFNNPTPFAEVGTFEFEGRSFSSGGAFYDPARGILAGYPEKTDTGYVLQTWHGEPIVELALVSTFSGGFGNVKMYAWRAIYDGKTFTGRNSGERMFLVLRTRKR